MTIKEKARLVFSDLSKKSYKYYDCELLENGDVSVKFGVVGAQNPQSFTYVGGGQKVFQKKINEKIRKGYEHAKVIIEGAVNHKSIDTCSLADIAVKQIKFSNVSVEPLIKRLANSNIHKITNSTSISFDNGVFQTPLGVVTQEGIDAARNLLQYFFTNVTNRKKVEEDFNKKIDSYLKIIPRPKGGGLFYENIFNTSDSIQKESDVIDALENSLSLISTPKDNDTTVVEENVFDLSIEIETDNAIRQKLEKWYESSKKAMHNYGHIKIKEIYAVDLLKYNQDFDEKIGNIIPVWHGSSASNILSILKSGLTVRPPSTAAIAGALFGPGVYGSETSTKALGYSLGRWGQSVGDSGWLMHCDFLMGKPYFSTTYGIKSIPSGYDSCWALPKNTGLHNDELIVYNSNRIRIKHLIELK